MDLPKVRKQKKRIGGKIKDEIYKRRIKTNELFRRFYSFSGKHFNLRWMSLSSNSLCCSKKFV